MNQSTPIHLLRMPDVTKRMGVSKATIYNMINEGTFPPPVKLGERTSVFPEHEVAKLQTAIIAGASNEEVKQIVISIQETRKFGH
ncbi:helix-turn-helix transcriptional regulator [Pseudohongiella sp.]|uniref:AlpA family phage regulatory protein n=1 Tax=marine sediment metagenome TaxID=412755 RepID=A0A0F9W712_9ZZZZ|nr:AlpA family phage regulatory protein [Pseudohongiella sp.]HDZ07746.1 AlpA family phage regulatory protein [Pseudohongiella sp.]HEA62937.1 AlpA family phage regulatory protein [Pseudohongiella sp.]